MARIYGWKRSQQIQKQENYNIGKPPSKRQRVPYWKDVARDTDESSDTVDTSSGADEDCPFFERSLKITPHAATHLAEQVILAGTHAFHNTAATESAHPRCIGQAALRSRAFHDVNLSSQKMLDYQIEKQQNQAIIDYALRHDNSTPARRQPVVPVGPFPLHTVNLTGEIDSKVLKRIDNRVRSGLSVQASDRSHVWNTVLCAGVPLSLLEIVHLVLEHLGMVINMENSRKLLECHWKLGWHVSTTTSDGTVKHYRGGGVTPDTTSNLLRGDWVETDVTDTHGTVVTSRLCRMICGIQIHNVHRCLDAGTLSDETWETDENKHDKTVAFILVRYAAPHPASRGARGPNNRPLCPGVLRDTHCLWTWAKRPNTFRRGCLRGLAWNRNKSLFGRDTVTQTKRKLCEQRAWYDLVQVHEIESHANVQVDPDRENTYLQSVMWC